MDQRSFWSNGLEIASGQGGGCLAAGITTPDEPFWGGVSLTRGSAGNSTTPSVTEVGIAESCLDGDVMELLGQQFVLPEVPAQAKGLSSD